MTELVKSEDFRLRVRAGVAYAKAAELEGEACPRCGGTGYAPIEAEAGEPQIFRRCTCRDAARRASLYNRAQVPGRLMGCRLGWDDGNQLKGAYLPNDPSQKQALDAMRAFVQALKTPEGEGPKGVILSGKPGVGKSHLLAAACREITLGLGLRARYVEFFHLMADLRDGYSRGRSDQELIGDLCEVEVLALDELGKGRGTEWEHYILDEVISRRYNAGLPMISATNYPLRQAAPRAQSGPYRETGTEGFRASLISESVEARVGARIFSRLAETCVMIEVDGSDWRRKG